MIDLDKHTLQLECPLCGFLNYFFLKQARLRDCIICRGCKGNIQLDDHMNECRKVVASVRRQLNEFEHQLQGMNVTINL